MNYFVSREELLSEIAKAVDFVFTAVARKFSDEDEESNKKIKELRNEFLLLVNTVGQQSHQLRNRKGVKKMDEEKEKRPFEEILEDVVNHVLDSDDHELILLVDELDESFKEEAEKKERVKSKLREIFKRGKEFIKQEEGEKKEEKRD